jgi:hypothetical protein
MTAAASFRGDRERDWPLKGLRNESGRGIENRFFTEQRLLVCASTAAIAYALGLAWQLLQHKWCFGAECTQRCIDFTWMWVSGVFGEASDPSRVYDHLAFSDAWKVLTGLSDCMLNDTHFDYPPTYLFITYPLSLAPYSVAFVGWMLVTLLFYLAAVYTIIPRAVAVIAALTPFPVVFNVLLGHNGFLTAGLMGLSLTFVERRPLLSGVFLGLLTYKPQLGILFPFALLAARNWRVLGSATITSIIIGAAAVIAFGYQMWPSFLYSLIDREANLSPTMELGTPLVSIYGFLQSAGVSTGMSLVAQLVVAAIITTTICVLWAKPLPHSLKAAALCIGSVIVTPYALGYDLLVLSIAVAFLVRDGLSRGFLRNERAVIVICWVFLILLAAPVPTIVCAILFALVIRRVMAYRRESSLLYLQSCEASTPDAAAAQ